MSLNISILRRITPRWVVFAIDITISFLSIILAYYLRFNFSIPLKEADLLPFVILIVTGTRAISFFLGKTYAGMVRYTGSRDILRILSVLFFGSVLFVVINFINLELHEKYLIPISVIVIDYLITAFVLAFSRLLVKNLYMEVNNPKRESDNVVIYGTKELALITKKAFDRNSKTKFRVSGFIDHHSKVTGNKIDGVKVYHLNNLEKLLTSKKVKTLIIAQQHVPLTRKKFIIETCLANEVEVKTIPDVSSWVNGELNLNQLKNIRIEDLLERAEIKMDKEGIRKNLLNKTILVTGAAGSIGSEIVRQITSFMPKKYYFLMLRKHLYTILNSKLKKSLNVLISK